MQNLEGLRILTVDDDEDSRELFTFMLQAEGAEVVAVCSAQKGLQIWEETQPHVLLCDIAMPETDGLSFIGQVRANEAANGKQTAAIAVTAFADKHVCRKALAAGYQLCLFKPVEPVEVIAAILNLTGSISSLSREYLNSPSALLL